MGTGIHQYILDWCLLVETGNRVLTKLELENGILGKKIRLGNGIHACST